jgi:endonuclease YncB( thermonuclease family)
MPGTTLEVPVDRPVDGDTVRVLIDGRSEALRILALDTEESRPGGDKPMTPWGRQASEHAAELFTPGRTMTLEFEGNEPVAECLQRYRDNFGRLLVLLHLDGLNFSEHMIAEGYSPYFNKYGHARFAEHHLAFVIAERSAQAARRGLWDQVAVNGSEQRNYANLGAWWSLRAAIIDDYRRARADGAAILNSRLDYAEIAERARNGQETIVFTELATFRRLSSRRAVIDIGSQAQPFQVFIPDIETDEGMALVNLVRERYLAEDDGRNTIRARRSYAYVQGRLQIFHDAPEVIVPGPASITDAPPA